jgi:hypothetical protein
MASLVPNTFFDVPSTTGVFIIAGVPYIVTSLMLVPCCFYVRVSSVPYNDAVRDVSVVSYAAVDTSVASGLVAVASLEALFCYSACCY